MFGYVRPSRGELKVKHYEYYKAAYCGLCNTLKRRYGFISRFIVNYDFTFLAVLLTALSSDPAFEFKHCPASPINKKCAVCKTDIYDIVADECVILYYHKLQDSAKDESFLKALGAKAAALALRRSYNKAREMLIDFDGKVIENLSRLSQLEGERSNSLDDTADCFGALLSATVSHIEDDQIRRPLELLLYHIGRFIYITDARDDLKKDFESGSYNPLYERFQLKDGSLGSDDEQYLKTTVIHSINLAASAISLLPLKTGLEIIENIVYIGLEDVWTQVVAGTFNADEFKRHKQESN